MKIVFVVLHYTAIQDTIESVDSIKEHMDIDDYKVIIVDNGSPDNSWEELNSLYRKDTRIILIHSDENLGFAKGNNLGFSYAKTELNAEFIILSNNDICMLQDYIYSTINNIYLEFHFAVMGPMIITRDGSNQSNPRGYKLLGTKDVRKEIKKLTARYKRVKYYIDNKFTDKMYDCIKAVKRVFIPVPIKDNYKPQFNVKLHGSFLIFSQDYISRFDGLDTQTFMYFEEDFLFLRLMKNNLLSLYHPSLVIFHKEDASTDSALGKGRKKRMFTDSENVKSMNIYIEELKKYE